MKPTLDMTKDYENTIAQLQELNYKLRIQERHVEANEVVDAIKLIKKAFEYFRL
jgi:hypothetical protein